MILSSLCYIEHNDSFLMLLRNKKKHDINAGKWIGVGGKLEEGESPDKCVKREIMEETGLVPSELRFRGIVVFNQTGTETEHMFLFTAKSDDVKFTECTEGELCWINKSRIMNLNLWEGDRFFLNLLIDNAPFFFMTLNYEGDSLISHDIAYPEI